MNKRILVLDKIILLIIFILIGILRPDIVVIISYFAVYPYLIFTKRKNALSHLQIASLLAITWLIFTRGYYNYNREMFLIFGMPLFPLFSWALGLFAAYLIYSHFEHKIKNTNLLKEVVLFCIFYIPLLLLAETIAYNLYNIKNLATASYSSISFCNCLHAPDWMKIFYFIMGPLYLIICKVIGLENPHFKSLKVVKRLG